MKGYQDSKTPAPERDSWSTPQFVFDWANSIWGFDIDLAADSENHKCNLYSDKDENALTRCWYLEGFITIGWLNPPYSDVKPWIVKAVREARKGFTTVMLIPTPNGEKKYEGIFKFASQIIFIEGRISFIGSNGKPKTGNNRGSCIVVFDKFSCTGKGKSPAFSYMKRDAMKIGHAVK